MFCQNALHARVNSNIPHGHLSDRKSCAFPLMLVIIRTMSQIAKTGHGGKRYKLSKMRPSIKSSIARWKPHNGQLIPKSCLYAHGSNKNTIQCRL